MAYKSRSGKATRSQNPINGGINLVYFFWGVEKDNILEQPSSSEVGEDLYRDLQKTNELHVSTWIKRNSANWLVSTQGIYQLQRVPEEVGSTTWQQYMRILWEINGNFKAPVNSYYDAIIQEIFRYLDDYQMVVEDHTLLRILSDFRLYLLSVPEGELQTIRLAYWHQKFC